MQGPDLEILFPHLSTGKWSIKSKQTPKYNCIAFAASETHRRWWPSGFPQYDYWPPEAPCEETIECFILAFKTRGYTPCADGRLELGYQKVAIYADYDRTPLHMARQRFWGSWVSKLGELEDILHLKLNQVACHGPHPIAYYGDAIQFMKRNLWTAFRITLCQWGKRLIERVI